MFRLTIQNDATDDPPAVEKDFDTLGAAVAGLVEHVVALEDISVKVTPFPEQPLTWSITADSFTFDTDPNFDPAVDWTARIEEQPVYSYPMVTEWQWASLDPSPDKIKVLHSKFDQTFRNICSNDWPDASDGDVESAVGYFYLVEIPDQGPSLAAMIEMCEVGREYDDGVHQYPLPAPGWYLVKTDSNGLWWALGTESGDRAPVQAKYDQYVQDYADWCDTGGLSS